MKRLIMCIFTIFILTTAGSAFAEGRLVVYCSNEPFACQAVADEFAKKFDVKVQMTRAGSGTTYAKILAEKGNPKGQKHILIDSLDERAENILSWSERKYSTLNRGCFYHVI